MRPQELKIRALEALSSPWKLRQWLILFLLGLQAHIESYIFFNSIQSRYAYLAEESSIVKFLLFNLGNLNNGFLVALVISFLTHTFLQLSLRKSLLLSLILTATIFTALEWNGLPDIPAALIGALLYAVFVMR